MSAFVELVVMDEFGIGPRASCAEYEKCETINTVTPEEREPKKTSLSQILFYLDDKYTQAYISYMRYKLIIDGGDQ